MADRRFALQRGQGSAPPALGEHHGGSFGIYMAHKKAKLDQQFAETANAPSSSSSTSSSTSSTSSEIFDGVTVYVNGYTDPPFHELKVMIGQHGGKVDHYMSASSVTHVVASNLPDSKVKEIRGHKRHFIVVYPSWIVNSIAAGKKLPVTSEYLLPQFRVAPGFEGTKRGVGIFSGASAAGNHSNRSGGDVVVVGGGSVVIGSSTYTSTTAPRDVPTHTGESASASALHAGSVHARSTEQQISPNKVTSAKPSANHMLPITDFAKKKATKLPFQPTGTTTTTTLHNGGSNASNATINRNSNNYNHYHENDDTEKKDEEEDNNHQHYDNNEGQEEEDDDDEGEDITDGLSPRSSSSSTSLGGPSSLVRSSGNDPAFMAGYFNSSRLHFIGSWRSHVQALVARETKGAAPSSRLQNTTHNTLGKTKAAEVRVGGISNSSVPFDREDNDSNDDDGTKDNDDEEEEYGNIGSGSNSSSSSANFPHNRPSDKTTTKSSSYSSSSSSSSVRVIAHVDIDCFFAQVALLDKPHLRDKPVVISHSGGRPSGAANAIRAFGDGSDTTLVGAKITEKQKHLMIGVPASSSLSATAAATRYSSSTSTSSLPPDAQTSTAITSFATDVAAGSFAIAGMWEGVVATTSAAIPAINTSTDHSTGRNGDGDGDSNGAEEGDHRQTTANFHQQPSSSSSSTTTTIISPRTTTTDTDMKDMYRVASGGEVSSANYPARAFGIYAGMTVGTAKTLCPDLIVLPYAFDKIQTVSEAVYRNFLRVTNAVQAMSCDEAYLDLTGISDPVAAVARLRADIFAATGCTVSAGVGPNMLLARLATARAKPNGMFVLPPDTTVIQEFLRPLKISALPGVGFSTDAKFSEANVRTIGDVQQIPKQTLEAWFGLKTGDSLYQACRGIDTREVSSQKIRKSIGAAINWGVRFTEQSQFISFIQELASEVSRRLYAAGDEIGGSNGGGGGGGGGGNSSSSNSGGNYPQSMRVTKTATATILRDDDDDQNTEQDKGGTGGSRTAPSSSSFFSSSSRPVLARQLTYKLMVRRENAPSPRKHMGHGICDTFHRSTSLAIPTCDAATISQAALRLHYELGPPHASQIRGIGIQMTKLSHPVWKGAEKSDATTTSRSGGGSGSGVGTMEMFLRPTMASVSTSSSSSSSSSSSLLGMKPLESKKRKFPSEETSKVLEPITIIDSEEEENEEEDKEGEKKQQQYLPEDDDLDEKLEHDNGSHDEEDENTDASHHAFTASQLNSSELERVESPINLIPIDEKTSNVESEHTTASSLRNQGGQIRQTSSSSSMAVTMGRDQHHSSSSLLLQAPSGVDPSVFASLPTAIQQEILRNENNFAATTATAGSKKNKTQKGFLFTGASTGALMKHKSPPRHPPSTAATTAAARTGLGQVNLFQWATAAGISTSSSGGHGGTGLIESVDIEYVDDENETSVSSLASSSRDSHSHHQNSKKGKEKSGSRGGTTTFSTTASTSNGSAPSSFGSALAIPQGIDANVFSELPMWARLQIVREEDRRRTRFVGNSGGSSSSSSSGNNNNNDFGGFRLRSAVASSASAAASNSARARTGSTVHASAISSSSSAISSLPPPPPVRSTTTSSSSFSSAFSFSPVFEHMKASVQELSSALEMWMQSIGAHPAPAHAVLLSSYACDTLRAGRPEETALFLRILARLATSSSEMEESSPFSSSSDATWRDVVTAVNERVQALNSKLSGTELCWEQT